MKLGRCPVCKSHLYIEGIVQDEASRELLGMVAKLPTRLGQAVIAYVGLFRPAKSDLSNSRAIKLIEEALTLCSSRDVLTEAMNQTVNQIHTKRRNEPTHQPLKNHNYLKQVISGMTITTSQMGNQEGSRSLEIKQQGHTETEDENRRKFEEQMARYGHKVKS